MFVTAEESDKDEVATANRRGRFLNGEIGICILAVGLSIGMFAASKPVSEGNCVVQSDSIVGFLFMPAAISAGQFIEPSCGESPFGSSLGSTAKKENLHRSLVLKSNSTSMAVQSEARVPGR